MESSPTISWGRTLCAIIGSEIRLKSSDKFNPPGLRTGSEYTWQMNSTLPATGLMLYFLSVSCREVKKVSLVPPLRGSNCPPKKKRGLYDRVKRVLICQFLHREIGIWITNTGNHKQKHWSGTVIWETCSPRNGIWPKFGLGNWIIPYPAPTSGLSKNDEFEEFLILISC